MSLSQPWQGSIVVGIDYDCREKTIYWTDVAGRTISRASLEPGAEPETVISSGVLPSPVTPAQSHISGSEPSSRPSRRWLWGCPALGGVLHLRSHPLAVGRGTVTGPGAARPQPLTTSVPPAGLISPEGLAVDHLRRVMFWTDSGLDKIERARLDGSERRVLFDTELVNPRAIAVDPVRGWAAAFPEGFAGRALQGARVGHRRWCQGRILTLGAALLRCTPRRRDWLCSLPPLLFNNSGFG